MFPEIDETLKCTECGNKFEFTAGEQKFFNKNGFEDKPKRCKECRVKKKEREAKRKQESGDKR